MHRSWFTTLLALVALIMVGLPAAAQSEAANLSQGNGNGRPSLAELSRLHERMLGLFEHGSIVFTDLNEQTGRLTVALEHGREAPGVRERLVALQVPADLVDIITSPRIIEMDTLNQATRPLAGGIEINYIKRPYLYSCTLGVNAVHPTHGNGFLTNSHCTGRRGSVDGTQHYQPHPELVAREVADPALFTGGICPRRMQCSYADVAFSKYEPGINGTLGEIKRTEAVNTGSRTVNGRSVITAEVSAVVGELVNKVGRTTGETQGSVTQTGVNIGVADTSIVMLDQVIVARPAGMSGALVAGGDSGSPVFKDLGNGSVALTGILWGGATDGSYFVYSPMEQVQRTSSPGPGLGPLTTCGTGSSC